MTANQPPTWCTCTTGGINPTCSHHAWQLPRKLAPPRTDAVIVEARSPAHDCQCPYLKPLADALEAAEAQVVRQEALLSEILQCGVISSSMKYMEAVGRVQDRYYTEGKNPSWPADLLQAVRLLDGTHTNDCAHPACQKARATLRRYGLLPAAPMEDARP